MKRIDGYRAVWLALQVLAVFTPGLAHTLCLCVLSLVVIYFAPDACE
jgi:hypothetical protein